MAGKRSATSELNHDNWDQDDDPEERGTFQQASENALKNRVIRTAKRRNPIRNEDGDKPSAFAGFSGFTNKPASGDFSFLKTISTSNSAPNTNGIDKPNTTTSNSSLNIFSSSALNTTPFSNSTAPVSASKNIFGANVYTSTINTVVPSESSGNKKSEQYCAKLKGLNESVSKWIAKKVEENPLISLQPIFKDYERYLGEIEKGESNSSDIDKPTNSSNINSIPTFNFLPSADKNTKAIPDSTSEKNNEKNEDSSVPTFKFGGPVASVSSSGPTYSFGPAGGGSFKSSSATSSTLAAMPTFSFGNNNSSGGISFPTSSGFSFGGGAKSEQTDKSNQDGDNKNNENDEDEPPKTEFKPVVEEDHVYTTRCKVFVKKGDNFGDRGVGTLYLKPIEKSEKLQLIVRADTNLGNVLLNLILSKSVPTKRMGKKDVMLVAIPTPDAQPPPVPLLLRVKSPEEADNLLEVLEKHKK